MENKPLWQQYQRGIYGDSPDRAEPEPQDLPTSVDFGQDEDIRGIVNNMIEAEFGASGPVPTTENSPFGDDAFKAVEEPSILDQAHFGFKEAWLSDEDSLAGTTLANIKDYFIAESPETAAIMGFKKDVDLDDKNIMEVIKESMAYKGTPMGLYDIAKNLIADEKTRAEQWEKADSVYEMVASLFKSKEQMESYENAYVEKHYGKGWKDMTPEQRREQMEDESNAILKEQFPTIYDTGYAHSAWAGVGNLSIVAFDPITYVAPVVNSYRKAAVMGATYGAIDTSTKGLADKGYITPTEVATGLVAGAIFAPAMRAAGKGVGKIFDKAAVNSRIRASSKILNSYEQSIKSATANGADWNEAVTIARMTTGTDGPSVQKMYEITGRTFNMENLGQQSNLMTPIEQKASSGLFYRMVNGVSEAVSPYLEPVTDVLRKNTPRLFQALRGQDARMHFRMHSSFEAVKPWLKNLEGMSKTDQTTMKRLISSGNHEQFREAVTLMRKYMASDPDTMGDFFKNWTRVRSELKRSADDYIGVGHEMDLIKDYFPRIARRPDKLSDAHLGWLSWQVEKASKIKGSALSEQEIGDLFHSALKKSPRDLARAPVSGSLRERIVPELNDYLEPHYADPAQALHSYFRTAARDIERANFFNRFSSKARQYKVDGSDLDDIIYRMTGEDSPDVIDEIAALAPKDRQKVADILRARFMEGEQSPKAWIQTYKNLGYTVLLGNPLSAITQLGDQAFSLYKNGIRHYAKAWVVPQVIAKEDLGLTDAMEELFANTSNTKRTLDWFLKYSGFNRLDKLGKDSILNTAYQRYTSLAKTANGRVKIKQQWGKYFQEQTDDLVDGLKNMDISNENVRLLLWHELSDVQPIALSEMPEKYLKNPNGRIFYMLKTFTMKQLAFMKREIFDEFANGNKGAGTKKLLGFTGAWLLANGTADALKDVVRGNNPAETIPDNVVENLVQMTGLSKYTWQMSAKEGPVTTAYDFLMPPVPIVDDVFKAAVTKDPTKALKAVPYVGNIIYQRHKTQTKRTAARRKTEW